MSSAEKVAQPARDIQAADRGHWSPGHLEPDPGASASSSEPLGAGRRHQLRRLARCRRSWLSHAAVARDDRRPSYTYEPGTAAKIGGYARREQDWAFQSNLAAGEINQIFKQLRAAQIREAIAELELKNHRQQMKHAEEIEHFLNEEGDERRRARRPTRRFTPG